MKQNLLRVAATAGLLAALTCTVYLLGLHQFDLNPLAQYKYLMYTGIYALFFIGAMKYYRDSVNGLQLRGQEGIFLGIVLNAVAAPLTASSVYLYLQHTAKGGELLARHHADLLRLLESARENMQETMGEETYQTVMQEILNMRASDLAGDLAIGMMMAGLFHTFLFMLIFKTRTD